MQKKILISLGFLFVAGFSAQAFAHSTIYTDELGRMHFLGKDNGAKTLQKLEDYDNPAQKDVTNVTYKSEQAADKAEKKVNAKKKKAKAEKKRSQAETTNRNQKEFKQIW